VRVETSNVGSSDERKGAVLLYGPARVFFGMLAAATIIPLTRHAIAVCRGALEVALLMAAVVASLTLSIVTYRRVANRGFRTREGQVAAVVSVLAVAALSLAVMGVPSGLVAKSVACWMAAPAMGWFAGVGSVVVARLPRLDGWCGLVPKRPARNDVAFLSIAHAAFGTTGASVVVSVSWGSDVGSALGSWLWRAGVLGLCVTLVMAIRRDIRMRQRQGG
jgi:hypothetical protein